VFQTYNNYLLLIWWSNVTASCEEDYNHSAVKCCIVKDFLLLVLKTQHSSSVA